MQLMKTWPRDSERWICMCCMTIAPLNRHGRCQCCDSDAVAVADTGKAWQKSDAEVEYMERVWGGKL